MDENKNETEEKKDPRFVLYFIHFIIHVIELAPRRSSAGLAGVPSGRPDLSGLGSRATLAIVPGNEWQYYAEMSPTQNFDHISGRIT